MKYKSNEVFLNSANNGNKRRNLMQIKILYYEVHLLLHKLLFIFQKFKELISPIFNWVWENDLKINNLTGFYHGLVVFTSLIATSSYFRTIATFWSWKFNMLCRGPFAGDKFPLVWNRNKSDLFKIKEVEHTKLL